MRQSLARLIIPYGTGYSPSRGKFSLLKFEEPHLAIGAPLSSAQIWTDLFGGILPRPSGDRLHVLSERRPRAVGPHHDRLALQRLPHVLGDDPVTHPIPPIGVP